MIGCWTPSTPRELPQNLKNKLIFIASRVFLIPISAIHMMYEAFLEHTYMENQFLMYIILLGGGGDNWYLQ